MGLHYFNFLFCRSILLVATRVKWKYEWFATTVLARIDGFQKSIEFNSERYNSEAHDRPRKKLDYNTLAKLMAEHMTAIAS